MKKYMKSFLVFFLDLIGIWVGILLAFSLRFEWTVPETLRHEFYSLLFIVPLIRFPFFIGFGLYKELWRYASVRELKRIVDAVLFGTIILAMIELMGILSLPRSIVVLEGIFSLAIIGVLRVAPKLYSQSASKASADPVDLKNVIIVGAGDAGAMILKDALKSSDMNVVAFIDDDATKHGKSIHGVKVLGGRDKLVKAVDILKIDEIIIAMPSADRLDIRHIVELARSTQKPVKILPGLYELIDGTVTVSSLREVQIEDLLGRAPVYVDLKKTGRYLNNKVVLVTGAGGSIGSEICRQVAKCHPRKIILLGHGENSIYETHKELSKKYPEIPLKQVIADVRDGNKLDCIISKYKPDIIYHAAAHKHVPLMELNVDEAITNNILGTRNLVEAADRHGVSKFIFISTDKAVNSTSVMGASKRVAEMILQEKAARSKTTFLAVRFGNVLGSRGSVVPLFKEQIMEGKSVTVTDPNMTRYFMTIPEASQLVIKAGALGKGGEIFLLDMGEPVKILDLATTLIELMGLEPYKDVNIEFTGIRPGEKLYEELCFDAEIMETTSDDKIWALRNNNGLHDDLKVFKAQVDELIESARKLENSDDLRERLMSLANSIDEAGRVKDEVAVSTNNHKN